MKYIINSDAHAKLENAKNLEYCLKILSEFNLDEKSTFRFIATFCLDIPTALIAIDLLEQAEYELKDFLYIAKYCMAYDIGLRALKFIYSKNPTYCQILEIAQFAVNSDIADLVFDKLLTFNNSQSVFDYFVLYGRNMRIQSVAQSKITY